MIASTGHSFRKIPKNTKAPEWSRHKARQQSLFQTQVSRELLLEMFVQGRGKAQITENPENSLSSLEFLVSPRMAEERGRRKQIHGKNNINNRVCLDHSPFLHNNCDMLNNTKVSTIMQIIIEITTQKCFCLVHLGWLVIFNLEQSFGFLFFSSEVLLGLPSPVLYELG